MGRIAVDDFIGTRTRFQRVGDAKVFAGWLEEFAGNDVCVCAYNSDPVNIDEEFLFSAQGKGYKACFFGKLRRVQPLELSSEGLIIPIKGSKALLVESSKVRLAVAINSNVLFRGSNEGVRILYPDVPVSLAKDNAVLQTTTCNVSENGMCLLGDRLLGEGEVFDAAVSMPDALIALRVECRYSQPEPDRPGVFRSGFRIESAERINRSRWNKLIEQLMFRFS